MKTCKDCFWKHDFPFSMNKNKEGEYFCELPNKEKRKQKTRIVVVRDTKGCFYFKDKARVLKYLIAKQRKEDNLKKTNNLYAAGSNKKDNYAGCAGGFPCLK
jgi:cobyrinic acid a,c-diamide synthase